MNRLPMTTCDKERVIASGINNPPVDLCCFKLTVQSLSQCQVNYRQEREPNSKLILGPLLLLVLLVALATVLHGKAEEYA